jgi:hypothetical protein
MAAHVEKPTLLNDKIPSKSNYENISPKPQSQMNSSKKRFLKNLTIELNISGFSSYIRCGFIL